MISLFNKNNWYRWVFVVLVLAQFSIRLMLIDIPSVTAGDSDRDYIVAHLIASRHQFPITGPSNGVFERFGNSPLYYYLISIPVFIVDNPIALSVGQIIVSTMTLIGVFLLAEYMFGGATALLAAFLIGFSHNFLLNQIYVWQPFIMVPFLLFSFIVLLHAYKNKSFKTAVFGNILLSIAFVLHNAALAFIPLFWILTWCVVPKNKFNAKRIIAILSGLASTFFLYAPTILFHLFSRGFQSIAVQLPPIPSLANIVTSSVQGIYSAMVTLFANFGFEVTNINYLPLFRIGVIISTSVIVLAFIYVKKPLMQQRYWVITVLGFISLMASIAVLNSVDTIKDGLYYQYTLTGFPLLIIILSYVCISFFSSHKMLKIAGLIIIVFIVRAYMHANDFPQILTKGNTYYYTTQLDDMTKAIAQSVAEIKNTEGQDTTHFFQVKAFMDHTPYNSLITTSLEKTFNEPFIKIDNREWYNIVQTNTDDYLFLLCDSVYYSSFQNSAEACKQQFLELDKNEYTFEKSIYSHDAFDIMVFKKDVQL